MARKMRKFSAGGAQGKYDRRMADIKKDFEKDSAGKSGRALEVLTAKRAQRTADAEDDRAKRMGTDRTATRKAEYDAEKNLSRTRRFGADKPTAAAQPAATPAAAATPEVAKAKSQTTREAFNEAFRAARNDPATMKRGTFTFRGASYTTKVAGEGPKRTVTANPSRINNSASTAGSRTNNSAGTSAAASTTPPAATAAPSLIARNASSDAQAAKVAQKDAPKAAPAPKRYETPAQAAARVAKLTGSPKSRNNLAGAFGIDSVSNAKARASLLATREAEKARNAERAKGNTPLISGTDTRAFVTYGDAAAKKIAARKAKGGTVKKETTMKKKPMPMGGKQLMPLKKKLTKEPITGGSDTVPATSERNEFRKEMMRRNATPGMKKGGKMKKYAHGGVTKEMPSSNQMGSMNMAKGGKTKMKPAAKGKGKGNPFAATKFGAAMMKKSADTEGRAMKKFAKGGSIDGCAVRGKTKGKMMAMGGMTGYKKGGKTC